MGEAWAEPLSRYMLASPAEELAEEDPLCVGEAGLLWLK